MGTWRTHLQVPEDEVIRVEKERLRAEQVATVNVNPVTAWCMLKNFATLEKEKGDWFVQNGANSGVGRATIQLGKRWGYKNIAVVRDRPGEEGVKLRKELEELGATVVVTEDEFMARSFGERVKEITNGGREKIPLGLNCVGGKAATSLAKVLSPGGTMVTYGAMSKKPVELPAGMLIFKDLKFKGFWVSKWSDEHPEQKTVVVEELLNMMRAGEFRDGPITEVKWDRQTKGEELIEAVQGTLEGFRGGKGVFMFGET